MNTGNLKKDKKNAKQQILNVALEMFASQGYHKTSTGAICKEAGISTGLLFYHFSSKEILLNAIVKMILSKIDRTLDYPENDDPKKVLSTIIDVFFNSLQNDRKYWDLYMSLLYQPDTKNQIGKGVLEHSIKYRRTIFHLMESLGSTNPKGDSFEFEVFRVGVFASYLANHSEELLKKAKEKMRLKYLE